MQIINEIVAQAFAEFEDGLIKKLYEYGDTIAAQNTPGGELPGRNNPQSGNRGIGVSGRGRGSGHTRRETVTIPANRADFRGAVGSSGNA